MTESKKEYYVISSKGEHSDLIPIGTCGADNPCEYYKSRCMVDGECRKGCADYMYLDSPRVMKDFGCNKWKAKER